MTVTTLRPGARLGVYPQRQATHSSAFERIGRDWLARLVQAAAWRKYQLDRVARRVNDAAAGLQTLDEAELQARGEAIRCALVRDGLQDSPVCRAFALIREYARRRLRMPHYDVQLFGAWVIVNGNMAEMATGEGKSLTATLAAATAAMAGIPVHIITTNEYLAQRDADEMRPLYEALGLSVTAVVESMDTIAKRAAYRSDIVYCTNKQVAFDYLRDRLISRNESGRLGLKFSRANQQQQLILRGLCFAIVDEADSVLIDEARTPLILSREHKDDSQRAIYQQALAFARQMREPREYRHNVRENTLELTDMGSDWLAEQTSDMSGVWAGQRHARFLVHQALCALHLFQRDTHYLVRAGKIEIIDRNTGRTMADRSWQRGLHQMIESKEDCDMTGQRETLASISYQQFFGRYLRLGGMSGTLHEAAAELRSAYQQPVIAIPPHRPCQRRETDFVLHRRTADKWMAVFALIEKAHSTGQPVLVGTGSVRDSELLGSFLNKRGLNHRVLNARQDQDEAETIALAGQRGQITIATSMAGRGTDIKLGPGVAELGGLHVISTECHEEYRVDRQLRGRCARQGDPGSTLTHASLQDSLVANFYPPALLRWLDNYLARGKVLPLWLRRGIVRLPQGMISRHYRADRKDVMRLNENLGKMLAYSGTRE